MDRSRLQRKAQPGDLETEESKTKRLKEEARAEKKRREKEERANAESTTSKTTSAGAAALGAASGPASGGAADAGAADAGAAGNALGRLYARSTHEGTQVHPADLDDALCMSAAIASSGEDGETRLAFAVDDALLQGASGRLWAV